jgi:hypothetical protein
MQLAPQKTPFNDGVFIIVGLRDTESQSRVFFC